MTERLNICGVMQQYPRKWEGVCGRGAKVGEGKRKDDTYVIKQVPKRVLAAQEAMIRGGVSCDLARRGHPKEF